MKYSISLHAKTLKKLRDFINGDDEDTGGMRYRTGPKLVEFFNHIGLTEETYDTIAINKISRRDYTDGVLSRINDTFYIRKCIENLFDLRDFVDQESKLDKHIESFNKHLRIDGWEVIREGKHVRIGQFSESRSTKSTHSVKENQSLSREIFELPVEKLGLDSEVTDNIKKRIDEIKICYEGGAYLSVVIMIGSILEGVLVGYFIKNPKNAPSSMKNKKQVTLYDLLQAAYGCKLIKKGTFDFGQAVRNFRNYIHPLKQLKEDFTPDQDTAKISLIVLQSVITQIAEKKKNSK